MGIREVYAGIEVGRGVPTPTAGGPSIPPGIEALLRDLARGLRMRPLVEVGDTRYQLSEGELVTHELSPTTDVVMISPVSGTVKYSMLKPPDDSTKQVSEGSTVTWVIPRGRRTLYLLNPGGGAADVIVSEFSYV